MALFTTAPTSDAGVTGAVEVSGAGYARTQVAGNVTATSATGSTITFGGGLPAWVTVGMSARDVTTPGNVPAATVVTIIAGNVVTFNNSTAGVGTDVIRFSAFLPALASSGAEPATLPAASTTGSIITFPQAGASWGTATSWGLFDAVTTGNNLMWDYLGNFKCLPFSCTLASPGVLTVVANGYANGDSVVVSAKFGGPLPTTGGSFAGPLTVAGAATDSVNVGVNTTSTGDGEVRKITQQPIAINVTASFGIGAFTISLA
jgi:hypothetical protein